MTDPANVRDAVARLAVDLCKLGVSTEQIADEFLITGAHIYAHAIGIKETIARLERVLESLRTGAGMEAQRH